MRTTLSESPEVEGCSGITESACCGMTRSAYNSSTGSLRLSFKLGPAPTHWPAAWPGAGPTGAGAVGEAQGGAAAAAENRAGRCPGLPGGHGPGDRGRVRESRGTEKLPSRCTANKFTANPR